MSERIGVKKAIKLFKKEVLEGLEFKCLVKEAFSDGGPLIEVHTTHLKSYSVRKALPLIFQGYQVIVIRPNEKQV